MEAAVSLKMTPAEFDLLRVAIEDSKRAAQKAIDAPVSEEFGPREKQVARTKVVQLDDLERKLR